MITLDNKTSRCFVISSGLPFYKLFLNCTDVYILHPQTKCYLYNTHSLKFLAPAIPPELQTEPPEPPLSSSPIEPPLVDGELSEIEPAIKRINTAIVGKNTDVVLSFSRFSKKLSAILYEHGLIHSYKFMGVNSIKLVFKYDNVVEPSQKSQLSSGHADNTPVFLLINEPNTLMTQEQFTTFINSKPMDELNIYILNKGISFYTNQEVIDASISASLVCTIKLFRRRS